MGATRLQSLSSLGQSTFLPGGLRIRSGELRSVAGFINPAGWQSINAFRFRQSVS